VVGVGGRGGGGGGGGGGGDSSTVFLTSSVDGGGWSKPRSGRFTAGNDTRHLLCRRLCGSQGRTGRLR